MVVLAGTWCLCETLDTQEGKLEWVEEWEGGSQGPRQGSRKLVTTERVLLQQGE